MRLLPLFLPLIGCIETNLTEKPDEPVFVPADTGVPIDTDVETETGETGDTEDTIIPIELCDARSFAAAPLSELDDCVGDEPSTPDYELEERWSDMTLGWMISSPVMVNLTDDNGNGRIDENDVPDVIAAPYTTGIYAMDGLDGHRLWSVASSQIEQSTPAVGDVDLDGNPDVFVQGLYGSALISGIDGTTLWNGRAPSSIKTYCGGPGIADFEGDGVVEIYFGRLILDGVTGDTVAEGTGGQGTSIPGEGPISVAADLDLDGELELVAGNTVYDVTGATLFTMSGADGFPAVGDFDSDPYGEILVSSQGGVTLYDDDGSRLWGYTFSGYGGPPAIADVDGDGLPEAIVPYQAGIVVLDVNGTVLWEYTHSTGTLYDGVSAYDFDGDDDWEVLLNSPDRLILFDGPTGDILDEHLNDGTYTCGQEPTVADIDNDGHAEIAYSHGEYSTSAGGITILGDTSGFSAALAVWNQHQYSITNINNDGSVPTAPIANWDIINNFRAGPPISYVFENQNLTGKIHDICTDGCGAEEVVVWWSLGNNGTAEITDDVTVELWGVTAAGEELLASEIWSWDLEPGWMAESVETRLAAVPIPLYDVILRIDGGDDTSLSEISECVETDNEMEWGGVICL
ncbi:MAG: VCBS repeat-containing protein [Pseudomonadota bacterium]|nr:VCBS repeat-containing protein [Pseudomonadota bacterium]